MRRKSRGRAAVHQHRCGQGMEVNFKLCDCFQHSATMHLTRSVQRLLTLYSRPNCGLCVQAKDVLRESWEQSTRKFDFKEVDITRPENKEWFDLYAFDVPVIHVDNKQQWMHRITVPEVVKLVDEEGSSSSSK